MSYSNLFAFVFSLPFSRIFGMLFAGLRTLRAVTGEDLEQKERRGQSPYQHAGRVDCKNFRCSSGGRLETIPRIRMMLLTLPFQGIRTTRTGSITGIRYTEMRRPPSTKNTDPLCLPVLIQILFLSMTTPGKG